MHLYKITDLLPVYTVHDSNHVEVRISEDPEIDLAARMSDFIGLEPPVDHLVHDPVAVYFRVSLSDPINEA